MALLHSIYPGCDILCVLLRTNTPLLLAIFLPTWETTSKYQWLRSVYKTLAFCQLYPILEVLGV
jgi:hypothetical protein